MKKALIKRVFLLLFLTANVMSSYAQAYDFKVNESQGGWECDLMVPGLPEGKILRFQLFGKRNSTCIFSLILSDANANYYMGYLIEKGKEGTIKFHLSNGEILSTAKGHGGGLWNHVGSQNLISSKTNTSTYNGSYAMQQLRKYNITKISVNGKEFTTPGFRSAAMIDAMCRKLIAKTGDQGQYGSGSTTQSSTSAAAAKIPVSANISNVTVAHNQTVKGENGMTISMKLDVNGLKNKKIEVTAYFYDEKGVALNDLNEKYWTVNKKVCSMTEPTPTYDRSTWDSYKISIPYHELHIQGGGNKTVKYTITVWDKTVTPNKSIFSTAKMSTSFYNDPYYLKANGSVSNSSVSFGYSGGKRKIAVESSDGTYEVWGVPSWCKVENKTSTSFDLVCNANVSYEKRTDYLKVKAVGKELRIDVSQDKATGPTSVIKNIWVEHNKISGLQKGMKIHVNYEVIGARGQQGQLNAYFFLQNGNRLIDYNGYYRSIDGQVSTYVNFVPSYDDTVYNDAVLFIPYNELHVRGTVDCKFKVEVHIGGRTTSSDFVGFRVTL